MQEGEKKIVGFWTNRQQVKNDRLYFGNQASNNLV